jgi:hypothetical protein
MGDLLRLRVHDDLRDAWEKQLKQDRTSTEPWKTGTVMAIAIRFFMFAMAQSSFVLGAEGR